MMNNKNIGYKIKLVIVLSFILTNVKSQYTLLPNTFYKNAELLTFELRYGPITGGKVTLELNEANDLFHLKGTARTMGLADKIFRVKDIYESYFVPANGLPVYAIQNVQEGRKYKYYNEVKYNRSNNTISSTKSAEKKVPENILDIMSVFYYIRRIDFATAKEGDVYKLNTFFSNELFPFELRYRGKETIETEFGKIKCLKFAPVVEPGRVFKSKDDMFIWYTDDENRIPILISMEMLVGHIQCVLIKYENLKNPIVFKK